jgi:RND family efflux transporter MFP subunit
VVDTDVKLNQKRLHPVVSVTLGLVVVATVAVSVPLIFLTEPEAERETAVRQTEALVSLAQPEFGSFTPAFSATGVVRPASQTMLTPRVSGQLVELDPAFEPGSYVQAGDVLARLDARDYEIALAQAQAALQQAEADLVLEQGRAAQAEADLRGIERDLPEARRRLVLREPQQETALAAVRNAQAEVAMAELELERTVIRAPYDAHVLSRDVDVGTQLASGQVLGRLVGLENYWAEISVPLALVDSIRIGDDSQAGSRVSLRHDTAWAPGVVREGEVIRLVGELNPQTRMATLLVEVPDPHARSEDMQGQSRLIVGGFVTASIEGKPLENVYRVPRELVRKDNTLWLMREKRLLIHPVDVIFEDDDFAYFRDDELRRDERIVTTNLATVEDGLRLRTEEAAAAGERADS